MSNVYMIWQYSKKPEDTRPIVCLKNVYKKENSAIVKCIMANHKEGEEFIRVYRYKKNNEKIDQDVSTFERAWKAFTSGNPYEMKPEELKLIHDSIVRSVISFGLFFRFKYTLLHYEEQQVIE